MIKNIEKDAPFKGTEKLTPLEDAAAVAAELDAQAANSSLFKKARARPLTHRSDRTRSR